MTKAQLNQAHKHSSNHYMEIITSKWVGCFYCQNLFSYKDIKEWIENGETALCPRCGIDSCIGSASGYNVDKPFLKEMHERWFCQAVDFKGNNFYLVDGRWVQR